MKAVLLLAACVVATPPYQHYRVVGEVGVYGRVVDRSGNEVLFVPCVGRPQVLLVAEIESTQNTCADGQLP